MVQVRKKFPQMANGHLDVPAWLQSLPGFDTDDWTARMRLACELSEAAQPASSNAGYAGRIGCFEAGLEMVGILADLHMDEECLIAALIYRAVRENCVNLAVVETQLGAQVAKLVEGVLRMVAISSLRTDASPVLGQGFAQVENVRKMLVAMVDDVRVALIKLAERTQAIRAVKNHPDPAKQIQVAREIFEVYAPLAHRLGIGQIKWELEDLSFRYLQPDAYQAIAERLDGKRLDRQSYIETVVALLSEKLSASAIEASVSGRAKHIYSIWRKMQRKGVEFDQLYDLRALRIMVPELKDCYASLGVVHTLWRNIPREFDDYIANPKENGYRSLHTAVVGPEGKVIEVQIRTHEMHEEAELGVCAHWLYKGADSQRAGHSYEEKIGWLRQVLEWHEETGGDADIAALTDELTDDFAGERIYVFTPDGHVVDVAAGSTPVDFAYHIHTEVGHRCRGAKIDGRIAPLDTVLTSGQQVEILTGSKEAPNRDWLRGSLGFIHSNRARSKIRAWFRRQAREQNVTTGRSLIERELKRLALTSVDFRMLAEKLRQNTVEDLFAALGAGDLSTSRVLAAAEALFGDVAEPEIPRGKTRRVTSGDAIEVLGVNNLLTQFARCCKPLPGDEIAGYVTVNRGVSVHRKDCSHYLQLQSRQPERIIDVSWGGESVESYPVDVVIEAYDRTGLLGDITGLLALMRVNVVNLEINADQTAGTARMRATIEIRSINELVRLLSRLNNMPNIISAKRAA